MVKSRDLTDHLKTGPFGPKTGFLKSGFQTTIRIWDHLTTGHKSTIQISDSSVVQMVTVLGNDWTVYVPCVLVAGTL